MSSTAGKYIIIIGGIIILIGMAGYLFGNKLNWIGRLPGDICIERPNFRFYFPITTMVLLSLLVSLGLYLLKKFL